MRKWLSNYFDLTKGEFNGMMVLVILIVAVSLAPLTYRWLWPLKADLAAEQLALQELGKVIQRKKVTSNKPYKTFYKAEITRKKSPVYTKFDPNTTTQPGWEKMGFSAKQAKSILNYVQKGGRFRQKEDLQKIYVVSPAAYEQLKPYVQIKTIVEPVQFPVFERQKKTATKVMVEINSADTLELDKISGIGPAFARRIVKYRERIGGFYKKEQLMEVFGLDTVKFQEIKDQVKVDVSNVKKLNINTARFEDLRNNPYLRYKQINAILQYREQHGNYGNFADLKKVAILTPEILEQLSPYISFTP